mgnify:CR=1 FL=1
MIFAQKLSKRLGSKKIKGGITPEEAVFVSLFPIASTFFGLSELKGFAVMMIVYLALYAKNQILAPNYIRNEIERKKEFEWERVRFK